MRRLAVAAFVLAVSVSPAAAAKERSSPWSRGLGFRGLSCSAAAIPDVPGAYYGIDMVTTRRVPGTGSGTGLGRVRFVESPYGVSVTPTGEYVYDINLALERIKPPTTGALTAWVAKADLSEVRLLGVLDDGLQARGRVEWNRFLLVVTLEPAAPTPSTERWGGPIVMRGMSRSGMMHTLAGHGPFEKEPCSKYGFK